MKAHLISFKIFIQIALQERNATLIDRFVFPLQFHHVKIGSSGEVFVQISCTVKNGKVVNIFATSLNASK